MVDTSEIATKTQLEKLGHNLIGQTNQKQVSVGMQVEEKSIKFGSERYSGIERTN